MMIRERLHHYRDRMHAIRLRRPFKVHLVTLAADAADDFSTFFSGHTQNLQFVSPDDPFATVDFLRQGQGICAIARLTMLLLLVLDATQGQFRHPNG